MDTFLGQHTPVENTLPSYPAPPAFRGNKIKRKNEHSGIFRVNRLKGISGIIYLPPLFLLWFRGII